MWLWWVRRQKRGLQTRADLGGLADGSDAYKTQVLVGRAIPLLQRLQLRRDDRVGDGTSGDKCPAHSLLARRSVHSLMHTMARAGVCHPVLMQRVSPSHFPVDRSLKRSDAPSHVPLLSVRRVTLAASWADLPKLQSAVRQRDTKHRTMVLQQFTVISAAKHGEIYLSLMPCSDQLGRPLLFHHKQHIRS
jgi:hypothetical protein